MSVPERKGELIRLITQRRVYNGMSKAGAAMTTIHYDRKDAQQLEDILTDEIVARPHWGSEFYEIPRQRVLQHLASKEVVK